MNQESGKIKQLKLRIPMWMYRQLEIYAAQEHKKPATSARHILGDGLMSIDVNTPEEKARITRMIEENWQRLNSRKGSK